MPMAVVVDYFGGKSGKAKCGKKNYYSGGAGRNYGYAGDYGGAWGRGCDKSGKAKGGKTYYGYGKSGKYYGYGKSGKSNSWGKSGEWHSFSFRVPATSVFDSYIFSCFLPGKGYGAYNAGYYKGNNYGGYWGGYSQGKASGGGGGNWGAGVSKGGKFGGSGHYGVSDAWLRFEWRK